MLSWLTGLFSGEGILDKVTGAVDELHLSGEEKQEFKLKMEALLQQRDAKLQESIQKELSAKERIIVAEMQQGDNFTKRARPSVVYMGLAFIAINYVIGPWVAHFFGAELPEVNLPMEFWAAWGGIVATWSVGRTMEKRGQGNKATSVITGSKSIFDK